MDNKENKKGLRQTVREAFSLKDTASDAEIRERMLDAGKVTGTNLCMMACANAIACIGLNAGSMTTCIGAMLLEPLMGSILLISYSLVVVDRPGINSASLGLLFQIASCLVVSTLYFFLTPVKDPTEEMLSFSQPTMYEVLVAFIGGIAGAIGYTRKDRANTIIPGVAIATALMLPLCTCGYAVTTLNGPMIFGCLYMFVVNFYFILVGSFIVMSLFNITKAEGITKEELRRGKVKMALRMIIIIIPALIYSMYRLLH